MLVLSLHQAYFLAAEISSVELASLSIVCLFSWLGSQGSNWVVTPQPDRLVNYKFEGGAPLFILFFFSSDKIGSGFRTLTIFTPPG